VTVSDDTAAVPAPDGDSDSDSDEETSAVPTARAVLTHVVRSIVNEPDAVDVDEAPGRNRLRLEVRVDSDDLGRVIGRRGRTAQAIRTVVRAAASRDGLEVDVDFVDD
jgi:predicted RNA-binding protein YlqC (UPF0109 family)